MTTQLEQAARLALEALEDLMGWQTLAPADAQRTAHKAITALRAALEQPAKEKAPQSANCEAPGWINSDHARGDDCTTKQPAQDEPVGEAFLCDRCSTPFDADYYCPRCKYHTATKTPIYTRPQAREPLSEDERLQLRCQWIPEVHGPLTDYLIQKTEAAHGIKEKNT